MWPYRPSQPLYTRLSGTGSRFFTACFPRTDSICSSDQRQHIYIIGKTGSGKTTLLCNLIIQHIALGHGVGVIDPHGDLAEELFHHIPPKRADHLVYFNPGELEFPIGLNVLANVAPNS